MKEFIDQLLSRVLLFATAWTTACQASLSFTVSLSLLRLISLETTMPSQLCHSLLMPSIFFSIRVFSSESTVCIRWPKHWSFSFIISPSNEYPGLISFRMDWFDLLVQETLKGLLQHHSSKASVLWHSAFFMVRLAHPWCDLTRNWASLAVGVWESPGAMWVDSSLLWGQGISSSSPGRRSAWRRSPLVLPLNL